jgi:serine phosphatase RsbU (regulator of sigma subunit)
MGSPSKPPAAESSEHLAERQSGSRWSPTYRTRLILGVCGLVLLTGMTVTWLAYASARTSTELLVDRLFREVSAHAVTHTRAYVLRAAPLAQSLRELAGHGLALDNSNQLAEQLLAFLKGNRGLTWVSYGDESGNFTGVYRVAEDHLRVNESHIVAGHTKLVEYDVMPDGSLRRWRRDDDSGYDPRTRPFYRKAREKNRLVWLPPYVFFNQGVPGISCAGPVEDGKGHFRGVVSIDFDLNSLSDFVAGLAVSPHSKVFLFTADETLLAYPGQHLQTVTGRRGVGRLSTLAETGDELVDSFRKNRPRQLPAVHDGEAFAFFQFRQGGNDYLASATTFNIGDDLTWVIGAVAPRSDFLAGVWESQRFALAAAAGAMLLALGFAILLARAVSGPVLSLVALMGRVGGGDLEARANLGGSREFRQLSSALNRMIEDLRDRLRLRHSLHVAVEVQQRLLPQKPPKVEGLDVAGHSTYCDETGGDYYDFLVLDQPAPNSLLIAMGDVMGHGVAAALVMAGARAVLRNRAGNYGSLAELMSHINRLLCADHEGSRFMTMHLSVIDGSSRLFRWASAGHDPVIVYDPASGRFQEPQGSDLPLGIMDDAAYEEHTFGPLEFGQVLTIGTDGVWEMPNAAGEQFGKERLRQVIQNSALKPANQIVQDILDCLAAFRGDCRPVDDVTFLVVKMVSAKGH